MPKRAVRRSARPQRRDRAQYPNLAAYFRDSGDTQVHMAREIGITQPHLSRITTGETIPRPELAIRIARYAKVPLDSFTRSYVIRRAARLARSVA